MMWVRFHKLIGVLNGEVNFALSRSSLWVAAVLFSSHSCLLASAAPIRNEQRELEAIVWTAEAASLSESEGTAARIIQSEPRSAYGHYLLAQLYLRQFKSNPSQLKLLKQASELGQQAMELRPDLDFGYLIASQVLDVMGYGENALGILQGDDRIKLQASWRTHFLRAQLLSSSHNDKSAIESYEASLSDKEAMSDIVVPYYITSLKNNFKGQGLVEELNQKKLRYGHRLFDLARAMAYAESEDYASAHKIYLDLEKAYPNFYEAQIQDAVLLSSRMNRTKEATLILRKIVDTKPGELSKTQLEMSKAHLASMLLQAPASLTTA